MTSNDIIRSFKPAVAEELLLEYNYFELYPNDGGGGFVMRDELLSIDDFEITRNIFEKNCLADYGPITSQDFYKHAMWKTIERSCWINRLYWIVPPSRVANLTNNAELGRKIVDALLYFKRTQTAPATAEEARKISEVITFRRDTEYNQGKLNNPEPIPYQWYDFQPAARLLHMINSLWFLKKLDCWSEEEAAELVESIDTHARIITWQEEALPEVFGNHQALRGLSLFYAGCFLGNDLYLQHGVRLMNSHAATDFAECGLLREISPQYHCFETWMLRDVCALATTYNVKLAPEVRQKLERASAACLVLCRPDQRAFSLNDGCNLNVGNYLKSLPAVDEPSEYTSWQDCKLAIWRNEKWHMLFDASDFTGKFSHYHAGKNAVNLYYKQLPFIIDSGCCHYDWPEFKGFFKRGEAHASLLVDGMGDGYVEGTYNFIHYAKCDMSVWENNRISSRLVTDVPLWQGVEWERSLECSGDTVNITDTIKADRNHFYELVYPLHPDVKVKIEDNSITLINGTAQMQLDIQCSELLTIGTAPGYWCDNIEVKPSQRIKIQFAGKDIEIKTMIQG